MTADDAATSHLRVERKLWSRLPQAKTLGKVFSLNKSKADTSSNSENEKKDSREDDVTREVNHSKHMDKSISINDESQRETSLDEETAVGDGQSVATGITSVGGRSRRSTRREKYRTPPISSRSLSYRTSSNASSKFTRDDASNAYSASTWMTSRYSSDGDDTEDDPGLPFSAFDSTIEALRALMGDFDDENSCSSYSDSSSDSESECDSLGCESKSVATCRSRESIHPMVVGQNKLVLADDEVSTKHDTKTGDQDDVSADTEHSKHHTKDEKILGKTDALTSSKRDRSVGSQGPPRLGSFSQEIAGSLKRNQSDASGYCATEASISIETKQSAEMQEVSVGAMNADSWESSRVHSFSVAAASARDIMDTTLTTEDLVEVSLEEFQTLIAEMLESEHDPSRQLCPDISGLTVKSSPSNADKTAFTSATSGTETTMPSVGSNRDKIARINWLRGLGGPLSRKVEARKSRAMSSKSSETENGCGESCAEMLDESPNDKENEDDRPHMEDDSKENNTGCNAEGVEGYEYPLCLDEHDDKSTISISGVESTLPIMTQNSSNTTFVVKQEESSAGSKVKTKPSLFARLDALVRKNGDGAGRRLGTSGIKPEMDQIPIIPTGSTHEAQDCLQSPSRIDNQSTINCDSELSGHNVVQASTSLENEGTNNKAVILSTTGPREGDDVEIDLASSKGTETLFDSSYVAPLANDSASVINDDQQSLTVVAKSKSIDTVADEQPKTAPAEDETRNDKIDETRLELNTDTSSQARLRESHDTPCISEKDTDDAANGDSIPTETYMSSVFCCLFWERKGPSICCAHCQNPLMEGDDRVEDDIVDARCGVKGAFHYTCHDERVKLKEKKRKVIRQIRLFGHLKRKHLRRQRTLRKLRAIEEAKKFESENRSGDERKQGNEESRKQNHFVTRMLRRASSRDGTPSKTRDDKDGAARTTRQRRVDISKARPSLSPTRRRSVSPMRRDRGHDDTNKPLRRRLREGSPKRSYSQKGESSSLSTSSSRSGGRKKVPVPLAQKRTRSLSRKASLVRSQRSTSPMRKVRFAGVQSPSSRSRSQSRSVSPQRMERQSQKRNKNSGQAAGGSSLKHTPSSSRSASTIARGGEDDGYGTSINVEDYKVVKIEGIA